MSGEDPATEFIDTVYEEWVAKQAQQEAEDAANPLPYLLGAPTKVTVTIHGSVMLTHPGGEQLPSHIRVQREATATRPARAAAEAANEAIDAFGDEAVDRQDAMQRQRDDLGREMLFIASEPWNAPAKADGTSTWTGAVHDVNGHLFAQLGGPAPGIWMSVTETDRPLRHWYELDFPVTAADPDWINWARSL